MILGSLIVSLLCFGSVQAREIFSFHDRKASNLDHDLEEDSLENSALYAYEVDHERNHLNIHIIVNAEARVALSDPASLWPDDKIPYKLSDKYDSEEKKTILEAMEEFQNKTCILFEPRVKEETPFILIEPGSGCSATVGKAKKGRVSLGKGCNNKGIIIHELMHTLGFLHEHSRPDRDDYVEINWENIQEKYKRNFKKSSVDEVEDGNITYDYNSIMHYGAHNFAKNRSIPTIITLKENVTIGQRDGFSENDIAKILERYGCGKAGTDHTDKITLSTPAQTTKDPVQSTKDPVQSTKDPVQSTKNPVQTTTDPIQSTKDPVQSTKNPAQTTTDPVQSTKKPTSSNKMTSLAIKKKTTSDRKSSSATAISWKIIARTTAIQKTTQAKKEGKALTSKLARMVTANRPKPKADQEPTPSHTTITAKSTSVYGSGHYRRYKRHEPQPIYFSAEEDEEVETPKVSATLVAEPPLVVESLGANNTYEERSVSTDFDDYRARREEWEIQYRDWWKLYRNWIQQHKATTEPTMETTVGNEPFLTQEARGTASETANSEGITPECMTPGSPCPTANPSELTTLESVVSTSSDPVSSTSEGPSTGTTAETANSEAITPECMTPGNSCSTANPSELTTLESVVFTSSDPGSSTSEGPSTGTTAETANSEAITPECMTPGSSCPTANPSELTTLESVVSTSSDPGSSNSEGPSTDTTAETANSEAITPECMTPGSSCPTANPSELTTLESVVSTSSDPVSSTSEGPSTGTTAETANSEAITPECMTPGNSCSTANPSELTTLESVVFTSSDPGSSTSEGPSTGTTAETANSEAITPECMTPGSSCPTANPSELTTLESVVSTSSDPVSYTSEGPSTGTTAETANSEAITPECMTPGSSCPTANPSELTTLESVVSTSSDPVSYTSEGPSTGTTAETANSEAITPECMTPGNSCPTANPSELTTLESVVSTSSDPVSYTSEGPSTGTTAETANSEAITPECMTPGNSCPTANPSEQTTLESVVSTSSDTGTASESVASDNTFPTLATSNSISPKTESHEEKTSDNMISTSSILDPSIPESKSSIGSTSTGLSSESMNSDTMAYELTTSNTMGPMCELLRQTTLGNLICTRKDPDPTIPEITSSEDSTSEGVSSESANSDSIASELPTETLTSLTTESSGQTTLGSFISTSDAPCIKTPKSKNLEADIDRRSLSAEIDDYNAEDTMLPLELAVEASRHSTPYHKIWMHQPLQGRTALSNPARLWPNGIVPYEISNKYNDMQKGFLLEGMEAFKNETCVRFVVRKNEPSYIFIEPENKCQAVIGRQPVRSTVTISEGCYLSGTIIHELMHSIGFVHEHNRPDRDSFVMVMWDNIIEDAKANFNKFPKDKVTTLGVEYDYDSVMHYGAFEFAKNQDRPTLVPLQAGVKIGEKNGFSKKDILKINKLYDCPMKREANDEGIEKRGGAADAAASTQALLQNVLKYFEMNFQRLFRSIMRTIQKFRPIILNTK